MSAATEDRPLTAAERRRAREDEAIRVRVREIVAAAPPLTERQIARLAQLMNPYLPVATGVSAPVARPSDGAVR